MFSAREVSPIWMGLIKVLPFSGMRFLEYSNGSLMRNGEVRKMSRVRKLLSPRK